MLIFPLMMKDPRKSSLNYNPDTHVPLAPGALHIVPNMIREKVLHKPMGAANGQTNDQAKE